MQDNVPLLAFVGRLAPQKGVDLIEAVFPWLMGHEGQDGQDVTGDVQLVMMGTGDERYASFLLCVYVCMYICMYICRYASFLLCVYICMYICMCICRYASFLREAEQQHQGKVCGRVGFTAALEHKIYAGADILLMPSRYLHPQRNSPRCLNPHRRRRRRYPLHSH